MHEGKYPYLLLGVIRRNHDYESHIGNEKTQGNVICNDYKGLLQ